MLRFELALSAVVLATALALAQANGPRGSNIDHHTRDYQALGAAKISLAHAIETAESQGQGRRAVDADFKVEGGTAQYEIKVLGADGKLVAHHVDAASGQITKRENHPLEAFFTLLKPADVQSAHDSGPGSRCGRAEGGRQGYRGADRAGEFCASL